jgi:glycosyltransferase involved in cell wall biosynthesis
MEVNMLQNLKNKIKGKESIYTFLLTLLYPYRKYLDSRQRKIYEAWNRKNEVIINSGKMRNNPLISIIVPTYNTPVEYLRDMIHSVENQSYTNWELIIVDDASSNSDVRDEISNISKDNIKIKSFFLKKNRHIAGATNYGIEKAEGEYIGLLDHDDILHKDALLSVVEKINEVSGVKFLYTDEIKLDENGRQYQPFLSLIGIAIFYVP